MICKPVYEFLLWDNCNNHCKFCWQRENPRLFNKSQREIILNNVIKFINSNKFKKNSHILIVGGEIFDNPSDFELLDTFFCQILEFMINGTIDLLYINTNLIYKDLTGIIRLIKRIETLNLFDRLRFTTSFDIEGRFKSENDKQLMLSNLKLLTGIYDKLQVVTNIILTKPMCQAIINDKFSVGQFMEKYKCWVNLIPYIVLDNNLTADREEIFSTLQKVDEENNGYLQKYITNLDLAQDKLLYMYKDNKFQFCSCENSECGHSINFKKYSDTNDCYICDLKELFNGKI